MLLSGEPATFSQESFGTSYQSVSPQKLLAEPAAENPVENEQPIKFSGKLAGAQEIKLFFAGIKERGIREKEMKSRQFSMVDQQQTIHE